MSSAQAKDSRSANDEECPVCITAFADNRSCPVVLKCAHRVCKKCLKGLLQGGRKAVQCPICRSQSRKDEIHEVVSEAVDRADPMLKELEDAVMASSSHAGDRSSDDEQDDDDLPTVHGSWGTKVTGLVGQVLKLPHEEK